MSKIVSKQPGPGESPYRVVGVSYISGKGDERKTHPPGATVNVDDRAAEKFVRAGVLSPVGLAPKAKAEAAKPAPAEAAKAADAAKP